MSERKVEEGLFFFKLGAYDCAVLNVATSENPIDQIVSGVAEKELTKALREAGLDTRRAELDTNVMLLRSDERTILVDAGWGDGDALLDHLDSAGSRPEDVEVLILTHNDGDHTGGLVDNAGKLVYTKASYVMTREAWKYWRSEGFLDGLPVERAEFFRNIHQLIEGKIQLVEPGDVIVPGVLVVDNAGHRKGQLALEISSEEEKLLHIADSILHLIFMAQPGWLCKIDSEPDQAAETRRLLLSRAAENEVLMAATHLPFPGLGRVRKENGSWSWQPLEETGD